MKTVARFLFVFVFSTISFAQISNLVVNGSSTHFTMMSGNEISWSYNLPVGGAAILALWIDVNTNQIIDPSLDVLWQAFYQVDGQSGFNGPPDLDGEVNGQIVFAQPVGLAPAEYIMSFTNNGSTVTIPGTVTPLASPVFNISGNIMVPVGQSAQYLIVNLESSGDNGGGFWTAITDASGNFSVHMNADTSGNPWRLRVDNASRLSPAIVSPDRISIFLDAGAATSYPGNNFTFTQAAAEINGTVKDDENNVLIGVDVYVDGSGGMLHRSVQTDIAGNYRIGFLPGELPASNIWLGAGYDDMNFVMAAMNIPLINTGNSLTKNLTLYKTNSTISGHVNISGFPATNLELFAIIQDTGFVHTWTVFNGDYILNVSNKLFNYEIGPMYLPPNYSYYTITAHPGQTNVNFNFNLTDVKQESSEFTTDYSLLPNYPNPFNPSTRITYNVKEACSVQLKVIDMLGNEIATLVNEQKSAGTYEVTWNAENLPSGIYFYQLRAGTFSETKKMILLR